MMASLDSGLSAASSTKVVTNHIQPSVIDVVGDPFWSCSPARHSGCGQY
jgi:hypothetical protein